MKTCGNFLCIAFLLIFVQTANAQLIYRGKITYERRTNIFKKFDDPRMADMIKNMDKIKVENFSMYFNDSVSMFAYITPDTPDKMGWLTMKNTVYSNRDANVRTVFMDMMGSQMLITDSLVNRQWKITGRTRKIAGYECTRAVWEKDDSTNIYAWFTTDIVPAVGPENVQGLPGAILGLATEDGGVVYFATKVESLEPAPEQVALPKKKGKEYTEAAMREFITEKMAGQPYGDKVLRELFFW